MYYADLSGANLTAANLSGADLRGVDLTNANLLFADLSNVESGGILGEPQALPANWDLINGFLVNIDLDEDGCVNGSDLSELLSAWGTCNTCSSDFDQNGVIDGYDLGVMLKAWSCGSS